MGKFEGKRVLVLGASSGIGLSIVEKLLKEGAEVHASYRSNPEQLKKTDAKTFQWDAEQSEAMPLSLDGSLDGFVYCPGTIQLKPFPRIKAEDFLQEFTINHLGAVRCLQEVLPALKKAEDASVVFFSTVAVQTGMSFHAGIASAKGAIEGLCRSLAAEFAGKIRFNTIAPSLTNTPLAKQLLSTEDKKEASAKRHPLGRIGEPEDLSSLALFLLSSESSWMSGQILAMDGGMSSIRPL